MNTLGAVAAASLSQEDFEPDEREESEAEADEWFFNEIDV